MFEESGGGIGLEKILHEDQSSHKPVRNPSVDCYTPPKNIKGENNKKEKSLFQSILT